MDCDAQAENLRGLLLLERSGCPVSLVEATIKAQIQTGMVTRETLQEAHASGLLKTNPEIVFG